MNEKPANPKDTVSGDSPVCPNCQFTKPPEDRFCRCCGQKHTDLNETVFHFVGDFLVQLLSIDGRVFRTLRTLLFHPGELTNEFTRGRRKRFLSPVQTYLVTVFLLFFVLGNRLEPSVEDWIQVSNPPGTVEFSTQDEKSIEAEQGAVDSQPDRDIETPTANADQESPTKGRSLQLSDQDFMALAKMDKDEASKFLEERGMGDFWLRSILWNAAKLTTDVGAQRYYATLLAIASQVVLVMLPLLAVVLRLLFWRSGQSLLQSFVLSSNLHVFCNLVAMPIILWGTWNAIVILGGMGLCGFHSLLAIRRVYSESWFWSILKLGLATFFYWTVMMVGFAVISGISLFLYQ